MVLLLKNSKEWALKLLKQRLEDYFESAKLS